MWSTLMWGWFFTHLPIFRSVCLALYKDFSLERHWLGNLFSAHLDGLRLWKNETDPLQDTAPHPSHRPQGMQRCKAALDNSWSPLILSCETEVGEGGFSHKSFQTSNRTWICTDRPMNYLCCSHLNFSARLTKNNGHKSVIGPQVLTNELLNPCFVENKDILEVDLYNKGCCFHLSY